MNQITSLLAVAAMALSQCHVQGFLPVAPTPLSPSKSKSWQSTATTTSSTSSSLFSSKEKGMPYPDEKMLFYALGTNLAVQVGGQTGVTKLLKDEEMDIVVAGFQDTFRGQLATDLNSILTQFGPQLNQILQSRTAEIMEDKKKEGAAYREKFVNDHPDAEVDEESGFVYHEITAGTGATPTMDSTCQVHYHGTLIDGTVFDSSVNRGQTIDLPMNAVIGGLAKGLMKMKEGGTLRNDNYNFDFLGF
mgnify:CR=1 FL=1